MRLHKSLPSFKFYLNFNLKIRPMQIFLKTYFKKNHILKFKFEFFINEMMRKNDYKFK